MRLPGGRGLLVVTVVNYEITDIGKYVEYSLAVACTFGARPAPPLLPGLLRGHYGTGQFVVDLPVSSEVSVKGGKGIWGMPKHQANLDFTVTPTTVSSQYDVDGMLGARIEIERPPATALPLDVGAVNYCVFRGMVMRSSIYFRGAADVAVGTRAKARLYLGDSPHVAPLHGLGIEPDPVFTAFLPSTRGVLDDHFECWFLTSAAAGTRPARAWSRWSTSGGRRSGWTRPRSGWEQSMKGWLLLVNALYFLFGATMYMGTMWVLRFFLYPTWRVLTPDNVAQHFGVPTILATKFFTIVVPPMFLSGIVLVVTEWGDWSPLVWLAAVCLVGIVVLTYVGQQIIIPVNKKIRGGEFDGPAGLTPLLMRWMQLNNIRFVVSTITWAAIVWYVVAKGDLLEALS